MNKLDAYALFDCGASHSFISKRFGRCLDHRSKLLDHLYRVATPGVEILRTSLAYKDYDLNLGRDGKFKVDLI